jgi:type II secretory pathway predicted ATPase ExeA
MPMFETYFGFRENPFKLERDISYLFWGQHHEEAVAHLQYAVIEGEGFIAITGERGVGKTIICRSFIDNLDTNVIVAYIDNPTGSPEELLKNINAQFKIRHKAQSIKALTDSLNKFLMQKKLEGKKVAVFIDDAQLLKKDSLEQVRLISNLETSRDKLIQIVLVGEPRLTEMLATYDLRQIGQRISVKYHIDPFNFSETIAYIQHRVSIASKGPPVLFDQKAFHYIFKFSGGIPRAINAACNRALMEAFNRKETPITGEIAGEAVRYLSSRGGRVMLEYFKRKGIGWMIAGCSILLAITVSAYFFQLNTLESSKGQLTLQQPEIVKMSAPKSNKRPDEMPSPDIAATHMRDDSLVHPERTGIVESPVEPINETISAKSTPSPKMTHSVQAGAFLNIEYAEEVVEQLKGKGYPAQIVMVKDSMGRSWYTVRIGDYPSKEEAQAEADAFSALEKMETAVRPFGKL